MCDSSDHSLISPTLFRSSGLSLSTAALLVGLSNFVGVAGMASAGRLVERFGPLVLVPAFWIGAGTLAVMGYVASSAILSAFCMAILGLTVLLGGLLQLGWGVREILGALSLLPILAGVFVLMRTLHTRQMREPVVV